MIFWFLRCLGSWGKKLAAFLEGGQQALSNLQAQETQAAVDAQAQIVQEAQDEIAKVENKTDAALADSAVDLGLVRRDGDDPGGSTSG